MFVKVPHRDPHSVLEASGVLAAFCKHVFVEILHVNALQAMNR